VHATAEEIFHAVNGQDPRASRATVYNSLRSLARAGLVREVISEGKAARYDAALHPHHHFVCDRCGSVEDIAWFELPPAGKQALGGRQPRSFEVVFRGLCEKCCGSQPLTGENS
jgi:Fur family peroxide stress response transcriptional regulator